MATMTGGRLAVPVILDSTDLTDIYTVPTDYSAIVNISVLNRSTDAVTVKIATSDTVTPDPAEYIEWNTVIKPRGVLERTQVTLQAGRKILVESNTANAVAITVHGFITPINRALDGTKEILVEQINL
jgi:hypothetical protein